VLAYLRAGLEPAIGDAHKASGEELKEVEQYIEEIGTKLDHLREVL
jgi:hypothetical protein